MKIANLLLIFLFLSFSPSLLFSQENYQIKLLRENKIKAIEFYNFRIENGQVTSDSIMNVKAEFNSKGYVYNTYIYDSLKLRMRYEKLYQDDTIKIATNDFRGPENKLLGGNVLEYKDGKMTSWKYFQKGEIKSEGKKSYNKKGLLTKEMRRFGKNKKWEKMTFEYNSNGQVVNMKRKNKNGRKLYYDQHHRHISSYIVYENGSERKAHRIEYYKETDQKIIEVFKYYRVGKIIGEGGSLL